MPQIADWGELIAELDSADQQNDKEFARLFKTGERGTRRHAESDKLAKSPSLRGNPAEYDWDHPLTTEALRATIDCLQSDWQLIEHTEWRWIGGRDAIKFAAGPDWPDRYKYWKFVRTGESHIARSAIPAALVDAPPAIETIPPIPTESPSLEAVRDLFAAVNRWLGSGYRIAIPAE